MECLLGKGGGAYLGAPCFSTGLWVLFLLSSLFVRLIGIISFDPMFGINIFGPGLFMPAEIYPAACRFLGNLPGLC